MSIETQEFHLGTILSVTHGILLSPDHMKGIYEILHWMTGDDLFTHQLPRAADECKPFLLVQHPELEKIVIPEVHGQQEVDDFLASLYDEYGTTKPVAPLAQEDHTSIHPLAELRMMGTDVPIAAIIIENHRQENKDESPQN